MGLPNLVLVTNAALFGDYRTRAFAVDHAGAIVRRPGTFWGEFAVDAEFHVTSVGSASPPVILCVHGLPTRLNGHTGLHFIIGSTYHGGP